MLERIFYDVILDGVAKLVAEPWRLDLFFKMLRLDKAEIPKAKAGFLANPPAPHLMYPQVDIGFPAYAIILKNDVQMQRFLGDRGAPIDEIEALILGDGRVEGAETTASINRREYEIWTIANDVDFTIYYYELLIQMLMAEHVGLKPKGIIDVEYRGRDLHYSESHMPAHLFVRSLILQTTFEQYNLAADPEPLVRRVNIFHEDEPFTGHVTLDASGDDADDDLDG